MLDVIHHGYVKISDFNIIVFDECHHGRKDHPMHQLMQQFDKYPERDRPRVIGLSGMLTSTSVKAQNVISDIESLEATFRSTIATVKGMGKFRNVLLYSTCPEESIIPYDVPPSTSLTKHIGDLANDIIKDLDNWPVDSTHERGGQQIDPKLNKTANPVKKSAKLLKDFLYQLTDLGMYSYTYNICSVYTIITFPTCRSIWRTIGNFGCTG